MKINHQVNVISITPFERVNTHTVRPFTEYFVTITMQADDGQTFVTFTRKDSQFASMVECGQRFRLGGKFKRDQIHNGQYGIVVTNCTINKVQPVRKLNTRTLRIREALLS